jgi:hypothetical protein
MPYAYAFLFYCLICCRVLAWWRVLMHSHTAHKCMRNQSGRQRKQLYHRFQSGQGNWAEFYFLLILSNSIQRAVYIARFVIYSLFKWQFTLKSFFL